MLGGKFRCGGGLSLRVSSKGLICGQMNELSDADYYRAFQFLEDFYLLCNLLDGQPDFSPKLA